MSGDMYRDCLTKCLVLVMLFNHNNNNNNHN